ncbi:MAG: anti-sigma factor antagonist [Lachnospiraceae bacterium]
MYKKFLLIELPRELDQYQADKIRRECEILFLDQWVKNIVLDFRQTEMMDSSGVGMIIGRYKQVSALGGKIYAIHMNKVIRKVVQISGLYKIMEELENLDIAKQCIN